MNPRALLLLAALFALPPAIAQAAALGELPAQPVQGLARCLRATGVPGELMRATQTGVRFVQAGPTGLIDGPRTMVDEYAEYCPAVAVQPNGAGVLAAVASGPGERMMVKAALRDPGGPWGAPTVFSAPESIIDVAAAVSERGDAVVAWIESNIDDVVLRAARRAPGGGFGAPVTLAKMPTRPPQVRVGVAATGEAIVAWTVPARRGSGSTVPLVAAVAPPDAGFRPPQPVGELGPTDVFALTVDGAGRALVTSSAAGEVRVAERAPGASFGAPVRIAAVSDWLGMETTVATGTNGGAVIAWHGVGAGAVGAATRLAPGAFGAPVELARPVPPRGDRVGLAVAPVVWATLGSRSDVDTTFDPSGGEVRAVVSPDGRAAVTWAGTRPWNGTKAMWNAARAAVFPLAGGHRETVALGSPLRDVTSVAPVLLADGAPAVAWTDNTPDSYGMYGARQDTDGDGRLLLGVEGGVAAADPAPPRVMVGSPVKTLVKAPDDLRLRVRCSAACWVHAEVVGQPGATGALSRNAAGQSTLWINRGRAPIAPVRRGPVRIRVLYGAPGARRPAAKTVTVTLRRPKPRPVPNVSNVRARRSGGAIRISWRTDGAELTENDFAVTGVESSAPNAKPLEFDHAEMPFNGVCRAVLAPATDVHYVHVYYDDGTRLIHVGEARVR